MPHIAREGRWNGTTTFVRGVTGSEFPTPFAKPPGRGMSPAPVNVIWSLVNLALGFLLLRAGLFSTDNYPALIVAFVGFAFMGTMMSRVFAQRVG